MDEWQNVSPGHGLNVVGHAVPGITQLRAQPSTQAAWAAPSHCGQRPSTQLPLVFVAGRPARTPLASSSMVAATEPGNAASQASFIRRSWVGSSWVVAAWLHDNLPEPLERLAEEFFEITPEFPAERLMEKLTQELVVDLNAAADWLRVPAQDVTAYANRRPDQVLLINGPNPILCLVVSASPENSRDAD